MIADYLERALQFERMAEHATDLAFKRKCLNQANAYRKLAEKRAKELNVSTPTPPPKGPDAA
jgi:hypothetical protein